MMKLPSIRTVDLLAFLLCGLLIAFALFLQIHLKLQPCSLCIVQRIIIIGLGILTLLGAMLHLENRGRCIYHLFIALLAVVGIAVAARHVWLEHLPPDQVPACGPGITYLFQMLPLTQALQTVFLGSGDCAKVTWRLLGFSIPEWTLVFFLFFALLELWQAWRRTA